MFQNEPKVSTLMEPLLLVDSGDILESTARLLFPKGAWDSEEAKKQGWIIETTGDIRFARRATTLNLDLLAERMRLGSFLIEWVSSGRQHFKMSEIPEPLRAQFTTLHHRVTDAPGSDPVFAIRPRVEFTLNDGQRAIKHTFPPTTSSNFSEVSNKPYIGDLPKPPPRRELKPTHRFEFYFPEHSSLPTTERFKAMSLVQAELLRRYEKAARELEGIGRQFYAAAIPHWSSIMEVGGPGSRLSYDSMGPDNARDARTSFVGSFKRHGFVTMAEAEEFLSKARVTDRKDRFVISIFAEERPGSFSVSNFDLFTAY